MEDNFPFMCFSKGLGLLLFFPPLISNKLVISQKSERKFSEVSTVFGAVGRAALSTFSR